MTPRPQRMPRACVCRARPSWCQLSPCHRAKASRARAPTGPSHIVSQPSTWLAMLTPASAKTTTTVAASRDAAMPSVRDAETPSVWDATAGAAGLTTGALIASIVARQPVHKPWSPCAGDPRAPLLHPTSAVPLHEAAHVLGLPQVLGSVVEDGDDADADGHRWVPVLVDDSVITVVVELLEQLGGPPMHRIVVTG